MSAKITDEPVRCLHVILSMQHEERIMRMCKIVDGFYDVADTVEPDDTDYARLRRTADEMNQLILSVHGDKAIALRICNQVCKAENCRIYLFDAAIRAKEGG